MYTVNNGADLQDKLDEAKDTSQPITIYIDGTITDFNTGTGTDIQIKDMDNVSLIGVGENGEFDGIGLSIRRANNIIVQNLLFHEAWPGQEKDNISIEGDDDGSTTSHIWIDHCELYNSLDVGKDYYDGLVDSKSGARYITLSYNYMHDAWKTTLHGHTENDSNPDTDRLVTFHHNRFENLESRVPLYRHGKGHVYNNYYNNIRSTAINSRAGAEMLVENNIFENTQNPVVSFYSDVIGYWNLSGNVFGSGVTWTSGGGTDITAQNGESTSSYTVPYLYTLDSTDGLKEYIIANAGRGKLDQSELEIPDPVTPVDELPVEEEPTIEDVALPYAENFATDTATFFSNGYRDLSGAPGDGTPMNHRVTGTAEIQSGALSLTGSRVSIGNTTPTVSTTSGDSNTGVFDLSMPWQISFKVVSVSGDTSKYFQIYVDNNTASSGNSLWGTASKFHQVLLSDLVEGQTYTVPGLTASPNSFVTLRTESSATVVVDDLLVEYTP